MPDDQEFWKRTFDDDDAAAPGAAPSDRTEATERARTVPRDAFAVRPRGIVERVLDRLREWRSDARFGVVMLIAVALVAGAVWYRIGIGGGSAAGAASSSASPATSTTRPATTTTTGATSRTSTGATSGTSTGASSGTSTGASSGTSTGASSGTSTGASSGTSTGASSGTPTGAGPARIAVHVAGAVTHPGVVELSAGTRVVDAVEAVGGAHADADLDRLNLAAKLADGQRIYVPKVGEADPGVLGGSDAAAGTGIGDGGAALGGKLNLNTATQAQLETLPGIGPTYAQSILAERQRRGGFTSVNELRGVRGIGDKRFAELAPLVTV